MDKKEKVILIISGGLDSTTLLYQLVKEGKDVYALSFHYGQKHAKELNGAKLSCKKLNVPHKVVNLRAVSKLLGANALTSTTPVPDGHYEDETMKSTVVPNRNMIMLSIAMAYGLSIEAKAVYIGVHAGDHAIYPDCREEFINLMIQIGNICHYTPIDIRTPYLHWTKGEIVKVGLDMDVDYSLTWTCYKGGAVACGTCGSCQERLEAFNDNDVKDPIQYA